MPTNLNIPKSALSCLFIALIFSSCSVSSPPTIDHPNVLFIAIDDLNDWVEPLAGNAQSLTPHLKAFRKSAVNFTANYCTSPGCNPSRSTLMTGFHTYNSGMYSNYQDWRKVEKLATHPTLGAYFRNHNYYSAGAGKIFHYNQVAPDCWDDYYPSQQQNMPQNYIPEGAPVSMPPFKYMYNAFDWAPIPIPDSLTGDFKSVHYIQNQLKKEHNRPFFLACGIYRPHLPWYVPQKYFDQFPIDSIKLPKTLPTDTLDLGPRAKELIQRGGNYHHHVLKAQQWKNAIQGYLASIHYADAMVGNLLLSLSESAYHENTIVVIWSDHGWQLGEKLHWRKFALWENAIRTLLMIKVPPGITALPEGAVAGSTCNTPTSLLDIYPTLIDLCQLPKRDDLDGVSLLPQLRAADYAMDRSVITTYDFADYSVRKQHWHYIKYVDESEELYDLKDDPEEWHNLAYNPEYQSIKEELTAALPNQPVSLPDSSLIPLMEHHVPPVYSKEFYFSEERKNWLKRFEVQ